MMKSYGIFCIGMALLFAAAHRPSLAQTLEAGPQVLTFFSDVDDTEQPYAVYLPPDYDASRRYPLVVSLHGAGSNHRLNLRRVFGKSNAPGENDVEASRYFPEWEDVEYIVASPYARGTMGYQGVAEKDVLDVLADVKRRFSIDEDRTYLTGLSMGGGGTFWLGLTRPDLWAALAPVCPAPPAGTDLFTPNALHLPVHIFQGDADPVVRPENVRAWVNRLEEFGTDVTYTEYPGVSHDSWVNAYADGQIFDWFSQFRRDPYPDRVRFTSDRHKYNNAFWVRLDALTPGEQASIDIEFTGPNRIEATTDALRGFTLTPAGHPQYSADSPIDMLVDGRSLRVEPSDSLSFTRGADGWMEGRHASNRKSPGLEGPLSEVIAERHIYVYGTAGDTSEAEQTARRLEAERAANWSVYRNWFLGRVMVFPRVVADRDVRPSDLETSNLVLFGTRETNSLIDDYADRLPLHLDSAATDYGLVYVFPAGEHYVLVNSGLPWWHSDADQSTSSPFAGNVPALQLNGLGDYLLFRGTKENVIIQGRFDARWRLPAGDAEKMRGTGVVSVRDVGTANASR